MKRKHEADWVTSRSTRLKRDTCTFATEAKPHKEGRMREGGRVRKFQVGAPRATKTRVRSQNKLAGIVEEPRFQDSLCQVVLQGRGEENQGNEGEAGCRERDENGEDGRKVDAYKTPRVAYCPRRRRREDCERGGEGKGGGGGEKTQGE